MTRPTEAQFQQAVVDLVKLRGWLWFHDVDSRRNRRGLPDLVLVHPRTGELKFIELKTDVGRLTPEQRQWIAALEQGGHSVHVWRPEHFASGVIQRELTPARTAVPA